MSTSIPSRRRNRDPSPILRIIQADRRRAESLTVHARGGRGWRFGALKKCPVTAPLVVVLQEEEQGGREPWCATEEAPRPKFKFKRKGEDDCKCDQPIRKGWHLTRAVDESVAPSSHSPPFSFLLDNMKFKDTEEMLSSVLTLIASRNRGRRKPPITKTKTLVLLWSLTESKLSVPFNTVRNTRIHTEITALTERKKSSGITFRSNGCGCYYYYYNYYYEITRFVCHNKIKSASYLWIRIISWVCLH